MTDEALTISELSRRTTSGSIVDAEDTPEVALQKWQLAKLIMSWAKGHKDDVESSLVEWIEDNGDLKIEGIPRHYAATPKRVTCVDTRVALESILEACGGDWERFVSCLTSSPIKHGAAKDLLGDETFKDLFTTERKKKIAEGAAVKRVLMANPTNKETSSDNDRASKGGSDGHDRVGDVA